MQALYVKAEHDNQLDEPASQECAYNGRIDEHIEIAASGARNMFVLNSLHRPHEDSTINCECKRNSMHSALNYLQCEQYAWTYSQGAGCEEGCLASSLPRHACRPRDLTVDPQTQADPESYGMPRASETNSETKGRMVMSVGGRKATGAYIILSSAPLGSCEEWSTGLTQYKGFTNESQDNSAQMCRTVRALAA
eukprot:1140045-Pelagomonas_calceolata.AAC.6